jgi:deoxyribodipyrimidine photo-lyase
MSTAVVVFTRDLRVRDQPALAAAVHGAEHVLPLFVLDDRILRGPGIGPNRVGFLRESLVDLSDALRSRGAGLAVRQGDWVGEVVRAARDHDATEIHLAADVSRYATERAAALEAAVAQERRTVVTHASHFIVEPGVVQPTGRDHFSVFTPYHRQWVGAPRREHAPTPRRLTLPPRARLGRLPTLRTLAPGRRAPNVVPGGETAAHRRLQTWARRGVAAYGDTRDHLPDDTTSHLSAYLHLGCISALDVERAAAKRDGADPFLRQLAWRDFFAQALAARPEVAWSDFQSRRIRWRDDREGFDAWCAGEAGVPLVDAAMHQLAREGFVHNRARMVAASYLTKDLHIDWRRGARHYLEHLVDGDLASNNLSWQWVAGTGTGSNPQRKLNPERQSRRFDPDGAYVDRFSAG